MSIPAPKSWQQQFWPGPLTLVLPLRKDAVLSPFVTAELETVATGPPRGPLWRWRFCGRLVVRFGTFRSLGADFAGTGRAHVLAGLSGRIAAVVDGGACAVGSRKALSLV